MNPWGLGRTFGGEAESRFVTMRPGRVPGARRRAPRRRRLPQPPAPTARSAPSGRTLRSRRAPTSSSGTSRTGSSPSTSASTTPTRWSCRCDVCRERFGRDFPAQLDDEVLAFREASLVDFLGELTAHVRCARRTQHDLPAPARSRARTACATGTPSPRFRASTSSRPIRTGRASTSRPARSSQRSRSSSSRRRRRHGVVSELWVPAFRLRLTTSPTSRMRWSAARARVSSGVWVWGYEACAHMSHLATPDSLEVWERACELLADAGCGRGSPRPRARPLADLDLRSSRRARLADERARTRPSRGASRRRVTRSPRRSTRSSSGCRAADAWSTSARGRPGASRRSTQPSASPTFSMPADARRRARRRRGPRPRRSSRRPPRTTPTPARASSSGWRPVRTTSSSGSARAAGRRTCSEPFGPRATPAR